MKSFNVSVKELHYKWSLQQTVKSLSPNDTTIIPYVTGYSAHVFYYQGASYLPSFCEATWDLRRQMSVVRFVLLDIDPSAYGPELKQVTLS